MVTKAIGVHCGNLQPKHSSAKKKLISHLVAKSSEIFAKNFKSHNHF